MCTVVLYCDRMFGYMSSVNDRLACNLLKDTEWIDWCGPSPLIDKHVIDYFVCI